MNTKYWQHTIGAIHWYCATCNVKSVVLLCFVFGLQDRLQKIERKLECGPMPNLMVALPNIGGALCSTPQSLADTHY